MMICVLSWHSRIDRLDMLMCLIVKSLPLFENVPGSSEPSAQSQ